MSYKYLFGPVPSRRLGRSLGVDLITFKTCSFDCIFCQLGRTTNRTLGRKEYIKVNEVIKELESWFNEEGEADFITLSGSGEPTLNIKFKEVIKFVKANTKIPCAVLTNGSLLFDEDVREGLSLADLVKVSLSCWDDNSFERINRPHEHITFKTLINGIVKFRKNYKGIFWLEVFLINQLNDGEAQVEKIADLVSRIEPHKVHLNTAVRPTADPDVKRVSEERMYKLADFFSPRAEVIAEFKPRECKSSKLTKEKILALLRRRPCSIDQICSSLKTNRNEVTKYIGLLEGEGKVTCVIKNNILYYTFRPGGEDGKTQED